MSDNKRAGDGFPAWADEIRRIFRGGTVSQFVLHGSVEDLVPVGGGPGAGARYLPLRRFLDDVLFAPFDAVVHFDRARGLSIGKGAEPMREFLKAFDQWNHTRYADDPRSWPREPVAVLTLLDRLIQFALRRTRVEGDKVVPAPLKVAVVLEFAQFLAPRGDVLQLSSHTGDVLIRLLDWARDPALLGQDVAVVLVSDNLRDLSRELVENPHTAAVELPLPDAARIQAYLEHLAATDYPELPGLVDLPVPVLAERLRGLSLVNVRNLVARAVRNGERVTDERLRKRKRALIEQETADLLEFIESTRTLDDVAGHGEAKSWLREDARLLREGRTASLPMGYLLCGRIGTGKTYLTTCWAGEIGIPCVVLKNFREKWVGSTEGNLEKIFRVLHALGQVLVFVDEADQATGRRGGDGNDSGLSGRVYGMLAKEMSDTRNRGRILWVFATSRPDLLEVDLKRPGRLDVHIPLYPPQTPEERRELLVVMARKMGIDLKPEELPPLPDDLRLGGNELESVLVRARRAFELQRPAGGAELQAPAGGGLEPPAGSAEPGAEPVEPRSLATILAETLLDFRPSAHVDHLTYMDLIATKECTDARFLPPAYRALTAEQVDARLESLRARLRL